MNNIQRGLIIIFHLLVATAQLQAETYKDRTSLNQLVYEIRKPQTNSHAFRCALEKIGEYMALEVLEDLNKKEIDIQTSTGGIANHKISAEDPVLVTVLRAGLPLCLGVQNVFANAPVGFVGMSRNEETLKAKTEYIALPEMKEKCVIVVDTMIATGGSIIDTIKLVEERGPKRIIVLGAIASKAGIERIHAYNPLIAIYVSATDPELNESGYIVPGLGDAGDRSYGKKQ